MYKYILLVILFQTASFAQNKLYMPVNFQQAYAKGTRSFDGKPGKNYWQNHSDYQIKASIDVETKTLTGNENIIYRNNSPDTLDKIVFRMYQNMNKLGNVHDFPMDDSEDLDGIDLTSLSIDGKKINLEDTSKVFDSGTNLTIRKITILPGAETRISAEWNFVIPSVNTIRMGAYDSTTFFIGYWYPQVAVYDDIDGWDNIEYTGLVEFYNDFSNFDVSITVPNNMCVWATGMLLNADDIFQPKILSKYRKALSSNSVINVISNRDYETESPLFNDNEDENQWHYTASNITDFAFAASDYYLWDARSVQSGDRKVFVSAAYDPGTKEFYETCSIASDVIESQTTDLPGVHFPFPSMTVFNSTEDGMEYPMMVNENAGSNRSDLINTTAHEISHSYFPFYMGTNERKYAWMDEGWAELLGDYIQYRIDTSTDSRAVDVASFEKDAGLDFQVPPMILSYNEKEKAYSNSAYFRPATAYNTLREMLGEDSFKKALHEFVKRWNGKHPTPYDFFFSINDALRENLNWFWNPWFFESAYPDLSLDSVNIYDDTARILVSKRGDIPTTVELKLTFDDGSSKTITKNCSVWQFDQSLWFEESLEGEKLVSVELGNNHIPDINRKNNYWKAK